MEAHLWQRIKDVDGYIDLKDVHVPPWGACFVVLVKFTPRLEEQAKSVLMAALSSSYAHPKIAIALDDDIDLTDPRDVFWAVATRVDPAHDIADTACTNAFSRSLGEIGDRARSGPSKGRGKVGHRCHQTAHMPAKGSIRLGARFAHGPRSHQSSRSTGRSRIKRRAAMKKLARFLLVAIFFGSASAQAIARDFVVGYSVLSASAAQLRVAHDAGIFDKHGLKVKPILSRAESDHPGFVGRRSRRSLRGAAGNHQRRCRRINSCL